MQSKSAVLKIALLAASLLIGPAAAAESVRAPTPRASQAIDGFIAKRMDEAGIMGLGAAIIVDGKVVWTKGYGFADKANALPFTPDTVMNIGSISKTFTGVALMRSVQEGKLALDENINAYLPFKVVNPHSPNVPITLRQLAAHTSGITDAEPAYRDSYHFGGDAPSLSDQETRHDVAVFKELWKHAEELKSGQRASKDIRPGAAG